MKETIGFIGLGHMGGPMAANLVKAGYPVVGMDLSSAACAQAALAGVEIAESNPAAVSRADIVITMLPAGKHVLSVWEEILPSLKEEVLLLDCSTIDVESACMAHNLGETSGYLTLDAPVSGGTVGAENATLTFMVGGSESAFARAQGVLGVMGKRIIYCGKKGAGQVAKICNNMILGISMLGVCEAFTLGEKLGLSHQALYDVASVSSGQCWALTTNCPVPGPVSSAPANYDYQPGFAMSLMVKDLLLSQQAALLAGVHTPLGAAAAHLFGLYEKQGHGGEDFSAIISLFQARNS
ncbi:3-hydroxyisobutyrate dehydrogenase [Bartonella sp. DGB2]|uniref:3-hydroxyisobutyrate dehydrogenase n=1 Tax=Bartonella sp. DGB2 TaxID=3388426 RepID=UPI00399027EE